MRARYLLIFGGAAAALGANVITDPRGGVLTGVMLLTIVSGLLAVAASHLSRRGLFDYLDLQRVAERAQEHPIGAGLVFVGVCLVLSALLGVFGRAALAQDVRHTIPARAAQHLPGLAAEIDAIWPDVPLREYFPGLIEHESCITLTHPRCWSATSRLKTDREEGAGLGQLTRAWRADGSTRFDALAEMREAHAGLAALDWATIYQRPDLQMRAVVVKVRGDYLALRTTGEPLERLAMADAAYNGGRGGVLREQRACGLAAGCDPGRWWGHVERHCLKSRAALYAGRSACDINRHHVTDVLQRRAPKYRGFPHLGAIG